MRIPGTNVELVNSRAERRRARSLAVRDYELSLAQAWQQLQSFGFGGLNYPLGFAQSLPSKPQEEIARNFNSFVQQAYKANGIVFACILVRLAVFSDVRLQYRRLRAGKPGDLFGDRSLARLERPFGPGSTSGDLLVRMEQDASLAGNSFTARRPEGCFRMRPDWTTIIVASDKDDPAEVLWDPDAYVSGYAHTVGGPGSGKEPEVFTPELVAHYAPIPDPEARFRGMSWITPVITDIMGDKAAAEHKLAVFERGGTPNLVFSFNPEAVRDTDSYNAWVDAIEAQIDDWRPGRKNLFLGGGADTTVVGSTFEQAQFKAVTGAGETRIAAAAGTPPILVGLSEGLEGAKYDNYLQARRRFADGTMRWLWRSACGALERIVDMPGGAMLWYDASECSFLQEDQKDAAEVLKSEAETIRRLVDGGFKPDSVISAVINSDWQLLEADPDYVPVQVQKRKPGAEQNGAGEQDENEEAVASATKQEG